MVKNTCRVGLCTPAAKAIACLHKGAGGKLLCRIIGESLISHCTYTAVCAEPDCVSICRPVGGVAPVSSAAAWDNNGHIGASGQSGAGPAGKSVSSTAWVGQCNGTALHSIVHKVVCNTASQVVGDGIFHRRPCCHKDSVRIAHCHILGKSLPASESVMLLSGIFWFGNHFTEAIGHRRYRAIHSPDCIVYVPVIIDIYNGASICGYRLLFNSLCRKTGIGFSHSLCLTVGGSGQVLLISSNLCISVIVYILLPVLHNVRGCRTYFPMRIEGMVFC